MVHHVAKVPDRIDATNQLRDGKAKSLALSMHSHLRLVTDEPHPFHLRSVRRRLDCRGRLCIILRSDCLDKQLERRER
jgi:hypothetical protein